MKLISMNIREIGEIKKKYLEDLIKKEKADIVCLQETKCKELEKEKIFKMWGTNDVEWVERGAKNNAGGLLHCGGQALSSWLMSTLEKIIVIEREWKMGEVSITIANIYSFGTLREKSGIWEGVW